MKIALCSAVAILFAVGLYADPVMTVTDHQVTVSGVTAGNKVVLVGLVRTTGVSGIMADIAERLVLTDTDNDGVVVYAPTYTIPSRSIWVAVDYHTGTYATGASPGYVLETLPFPTINAPTGTSTSQTVTNQHSALSVFVTRPESGAWSMTARRITASGSTSRSIHTNSVQQPDVALQDTTAFLGSGSYDHTTAGDVLIAIAPAQMELYVTKVTQ